MEERSTVLTSDDECQGQERLLLSCALTEAASGFIDMRALAYSS